MRIRLSYLALGRDKLYPERVTWPLVDDVCSDIACILWSRHLGPCFARFPGVWYFYRSDRIGKLT